MKGKQGNTKEEVLRKHIGLLFTAMIVLIMLCISGMGLLNYLAEENMTMPSASLKEETTYVEMAEGESLPSMKDVLKQIDKYQIGTATTQVELNTNQKIWGIYTVSDLELEIAVAGIAEEENVSDAVLSTFASAGIYQFEEMQTIYQEKSSSTGSLNGFFTSYTAGKINMDHDYGNKERYIMLYKIKLDEDKNIGVAALLESADKLEEAKECLDMFSYYLTCELELDKSGTGTEQTGNEEETVTSTISENSTDENGGTKNSTGNAMAMGTDTQKAYEAGQAIEKENGMYAALTPNDYTDVEEGGTQQVKVVGDATIIKDVNYDYTISLVSPYECLRAVYNYIDVNKSPDSVVLISPSGDCYYPDEEESGFGEVVIYIENAKAGNYTLSVRSSESLGGSFVTYSEKSEYEAGLSDNKYQ
ncbi:MAG: hypothetical protein IJN92_03785 [Lachnospiraceae bacterium]|nr:hypothetical protein [Lachnospiraceae bacterium]